MDQQEIFNRVVRHLLAQGRRAVDEAGDFAYRGCEGGTCSIGCLIDDEHYSREFENERLVDSRDIQHAVAASIGQKLRADDIALLQSLQDVHDGTPVDLWPVSLAGVAADYGLTMPEAS